MKRIVTAVLLLMHITIRSFSQDRDYCADFTNNTNGTAVTITMNSDANGCYVLINYKNAYQTVGMAGLTYPHGLELVLTNWPGSLESTRFLLKSLRPDAGILLSTVARNGSSDVQDTEPLCPGMTIVIALS